MKNQQGAAPGSKPRLAKQSATPALRTALIDPEWYQGVKISKNFPTLSTRKHSKNKYLA